MKVSVKYLVIFCLVFTSIQFWFGISGVTMEAKGTMILFAPFGPYFMNWLLLMFAAFRATTANGRREIVIFVSAMILHYSITVFRVAGEIQNYRLTPNYHEGLGLILSRYPETLVYGALTYVLGNLIIWTLFVKAVLFRNESSVR